MLPIVLNDSTSVLQIAKFSEIKDFIHQSLVGDTFWQKYDSGIMNTKKSVVLENFISHPLPP